MAVKRIGMAQALARPQTVAVQRTAPLAVPNTTTTAINPLSEGADSLNQANFGQALINKAASGQGFDPQGGWGVAAAQIATAGIGAWAQNRARKEIAEKEVASQQQFAQQFPQYADMASQLSPETRQAYTVAKMSQDLKAANPEPLTGIAKLGADYKAGLIDKSTYNAALKKETSFAPDSASSGGATGAIIANLRKENPNLTYAQALTQAQGLSRQGLTYDADGKIIPQTGLTTAKSDISAATAEGTAKGTAKGTAEINLPTTVAQGQNALDLIDSILTDKGLSDVVGVKGGGAMMQNLGINATVVGTKAADFNAKFEQLQGKNFLQAYSQLKGAGAISENEGKTATKAISDMQTSTSEKAFKEAGARLKTVIASGVEREKQKAGNISSTDTGIKRVRTFNPQTGRLE